ncbi:MAG: hypothetical protein NZ108_09595 [Bacteroidia bacterium]|nr:hypothetical protein [Bacteroidia bacterium]
MIRLLGVFLWFALGSPIYAQYHLFEAGTQLGTGFPVSLIAADGVSAGLPVEVHSFLSHYRCGKRDGFHVEAGYKYSRLSEEQFTRSQPTLLSASDFGGTQYHFHQADFGLYYKIRRKKYHRPKEGAFLIGASANLLIYSHYANLNFSGNYASDFYRQVGFILPAAHVSYWYRIQFERKLKKKLSLFIRPGLNAYVQPMVSTPEKKVLLVYPFLRVAFTFWNNL